MRSLASWEAQVGDLALPKFRALKAWAKSRRFIPGPGILWRETPEGVKVWALSVAEPVAPFAVSWSSGVFRIEPGTLDGEPVAIGKVYLDGRRVGAKPGTAAGERPVLPIGKEQPKVESWVALRRAAGDGEMESGSDGAAAQVVHVLAVDPKLQPLARIVWNGGTVERVQQIVRHDLRSWPVPGSEVVLYWAV